MFGPCLCPGSGPGPGSGSGSGLGFNSNFESCFDLHLHLFFYFYMMNTYVDKLGNCVRSLNKNSIDSMDNLWLHVQVSNK